ncbi:MAG: S41 family peptidase [Candidatus Aminicenantes bacterium]|nr:MAG: S41 family peptidase [Candidatus Aminicenantes bacterium]
MNKISAIVDLIDQNYFEAVDHEELAFSSIKGMLQTLDPHSYFLDPRHFDRVREEYKGKYYGLGILIQKQDKRLVVISPTEGGPAYRLGIRSGDVISHIEGETTEPITSTEAMMRLRGPKDTKVTITIAREGWEDPFDVTIVREEIALHSVQYAFILQDDIGYIRIRNFAETTTREFEEKMALLSKQGMKKLILDLRNNGGGTFLQSIELSDEFLPEGTLVVSIKGRNRYLDRKYFAKKNGQHEKIPLVILIDGASASAPEILSGAVKDNDRGLIVGQDSWGKGLVQTIVPLAPNAAVALTTAKYYTPSGRSIQRDYSSFEDYYIYRKETPEDQREVSYTTGGRKVLGQGGITPDYEVEFPFNRLVYDLLLKGNVFTYAKKFIEKKRPVSENYLFPGDNRNKDAASPKKAVDQNFVVDQDIIEDFKAYIQDEKFEFEEEKFPAAKHELKRWLEREIHSALWGIEMGAKAYQKTDPAVLKALEVFPEAVALVKDKIP